MAAIEAIYIIDLNGKVVLDYPTCPSPPPIETLIPYIISPENGLILSASTDSIRSDTTSAQLLHEYQRQLRPPIIEVSSSLLLFHQKYGNIIFLLPCSSTTPAFLPYEFIARLIETFESYLSAPLLPTKIESNFDIIAMVLAEMIDGGLPVTTEPDAIHDLVQPSGAISKLISTATGNMPSHTITNPSDIPWRRANVRHANNELFVDIIETITSVIPPTRKATASFSTAASSAYSSAVPSGPTTSRPLISRVDGNVFISSHLSGVPEVSLSLNTGSHKLLYPAFHPCVRYEKFENYAPDSATSPSSNGPGGPSAISNSSAGKHATFSFIPPDGKFLLASYTLDHVSLGLVQADLRTGLGPKRDEFEVRVWTLMSRDTKYIENLSLSIAYDSDLIRVLKPLRVSTGDLNAVPGASAAEWQFGAKTPLGWNATLRGTLVKIEAEADSEDETKDDNKDQEVVVVSSKPRAHKSATSLFDLQNTEDNESIASTDEKKKKKKKSKKKTKDSDDSVSPPPSSAHKVFQKPVPTPKLLSNKPIYPTHVTLSYKAIGQVPSGTKVQSLKITNSRGSGDSATKPFKGVRYITLTGDYVIR
ncbi:uncharacterized protein SAPINGB_P000602 [Magnusiomyces paraingens]|uniref:MHD domain-containing protein n=1 Tax=Magnusiomyces paraingens TaxID=2606893 RepID=A0A5E8B5V1_9ASCO|nr:uncharacterized protein SAPINGB_P000602 [Saprochaete ingens]VVT44993.1 unnamed protein product [Saprochaete ingens]